MSEEKKEPFKEIYETEEKKKEKEFVGQLLRGTNLTPKEIATQVNVPIRMVYRHPAWKDRKTQKVEAIKTEREPSAQPPKIEFSPTETEAPGGFPGVIATEAETSTETTEAAPGPEIKVPEIKLRYGAFTGIIDSGFELFTDAVKLTKPNPVKLQKLDHALVDFFVAFHLDIGDPRILASIILFGTVAEIGVPMVKEVRARQKKGTSTTKAPGSPLETALADKLPPISADASKEMADRVGQALG